MKGMGILELMTFLLLKRQGLPLRRSLSFLAAADEEAGSTYGVSWLAEASLPMASFRVWCPPRNSPACTDTTNVLALRIFRLGCKFCMK